MSNYGFTKLDIQWLETATIKKIQNEMMLDKLKSKEIVMMYLKMISEYDKGSGNINSIIEINSDALHIAEAMDFELHNKGPRSPLHGIPVILKDNIDTGDKMHTSAGSLALANSYADRDAFIVQKLREAGAVILGKANLTEWANFMTENMSNGYSSRGGQVLNPYGPGVLDVGGSSSGPAAAVAANFTILAIGTETSGSILSPASQNSVVGIKPTIGLVSRTGIIPISHTQDTAGPIARNVTDAAILLSVMCGIDENDPITKTQYHNKFSDYTVYLDADGLKGTRIGVPRNVFYDNLEDDKLKLINNAIEKLKAEGADVVEPIDIPSAEMDTNYDVLLYDFKVDLNSYLSKLSPHVPVHSLKELIEFNAKVPEKRLKYGQTILEAAEKTSGTLTEPQYFDALSRDMEYSKNQGIDYIMDNYNLDALVFPNNYGAGIAAKAGYPSITVPAGYTENGEPVGLTFTSRAFHEPTLIKLAYAFEQATKHRVPPKL